jgi:hypothetical protein
MATRDIPIFVQDPFVGRTPGQGERANPFTVGQSYYARDMHDKDRIVAYLRWSALMDVDTHYEDFSSLGAEVSPPPREFWIPVDFFGMLSRLMRHYTFGPLFSVRGKPGADNDDAVRRISRTNHIDTLFSQAAEQVTTLGDTVFRVDIEDIEDEASDSDALIPQAQIKSVNPANFFPELDPLDSTRMTQATLAWVFDSSEEYQGEQGLRSPRVVLLEIHTPGSVKYELWEWDGTKVGKQLSVSSRFTELEDGETGIDEIPIVHVGNSTRAGEFWGISEFRRVERIVLALENRLSQEDEVLDKHARPKLIVGPGILDNRGRSSLADFDVIEIEPSILEKAVKPEYLTWNMQISAIQHEVEKLEEYLFITTETSPASFGLERDGSQVESARALRFKAHRTVNKVNDLRQSFDIGIRDLFRISQKMENAALREDGAAEYQRGAISIHWPDPIIEDQEAEVMQYVAQKGAGLVSTKRALADLHNLTNTEADAEVQEILQDKVDDAASQGSAEPVLPLLELPEAPSTSGPTLTPLPPETEAPPPDLTQEDGLGVAEDIQKTLLNGAQVSSMVNIVTQVAAHELPRDAGLQIIQVAFGVSQQEAEEIMGEAGLDEPKPDEALPEERGKVPLGREPSKTV